MQQGEPAVPGGRFTEDFAVGERLSHERYQVPNEDARYVEDQVLQGHLERQFESGQRGDYSRSGRAQVRAERQRVHALMMLRLTSGVMMDVNTKLLSIPVMMAKKPEQEQHTCVNSSMWLISKNHFSYSFSYICLR